jgi:outer membrane protein assembly factor BamE (lipoprotein component of BamABCDE complex)
VQPGSPVTDLIFHQDRLLVPVDCPAGTLAFLDVRIFLLELLQELPELGYVVGLLLRQFHELNGGKRYKNVILLRGPLQSASLSPRMFMKKLILTLFACASLLVAAACDREGRPVGEFGLSRLTTGMSDESDVRLIMGEPNTVFQEDDGTRILEYPKGPEGARTWMFRIGSDGKLQEYHQALTEENFAKIKLGMSKGEVTWLLGTPRTVVPFKRLNEEVWDWRYLSANPATQLFNVHFDMTSGDVKRTSTSDEPSRQGG